MRARYYLLGCLLAGCAALQVPEQHKKTQKKAADPDSPAEPADPDSEPDDEDAGVAKISSTVRKLNEALRAKKFTDATSLLKRAERYVQKASEVTRSHPDFEDIAEVVGRARQRVDTAIEQDRIERREAAINELLRRGERAIARGTALYAELKSRVPSREDVALFSEIISELTNAKADGVQYADEARYQIHAQDRDIKADAIIVRRDQALMQLQLMDTAGQAVALAQQAATAANSATSLDAKAQALQRAAEAFRKCTASVAAVEDARQFNGDLLLETALGRLTIDETKRRCTSAGGKAQAQADNKAWEHRIQEMVQVLNREVEAYRGTHSASDALARLQQAMAALATCQRVIDDAQLLPGHTPAQKFSTVLGELNVGKLRDACTQALRDMAQAEPALRWRQSLEGLAKDLAPIKQASEAAAQAAQLGQQVTLWNQAVEGLTGCVNRARDLADAQGAQRKLAVPTPYGEVTVGALQKACAAQLAQAQGELTKARQAVDQNEFLSTCQGDEKDVVTREGVPTHINKVQGGRIFVYDTGDGAPKRFGFDTAGKRFDFWAQWRSQMTDLATEVRAAVEPTRQSADGETLLKRVDAARNILGVCRDALEQVEQQPGYDADAKIDSLFGALTAAQLRAACVKESDALHARLPAIRWQIRLERLRQRADEAVTDVERATQAEGAKVKIDALTAALGGFTECQEQAQALAKDPTANKKMQVTSKLGSLDVRGFDKACKKQHDAAQGLFRAALELKKLEEFLATCKGDELEVARREGIPARVEDLAGGRVFHYGKRKGEKRFAFDSSGKRADEKALRSQR